MDLFITKKVMQSLFSSLVAVADNVSGVYEVGAFKAQMFIPPQKFNRSIKVDCLIISPNLINTLLAVVAVLQGQTLKQWKIYSKTLVK